MNHASDPASRQRDRASNGKTLLPPRLCVLMYHDVVDAMRPDASGFQGHGANSYKVSSARFSDHLRALADRLRTPPANLASRADATNVVGWSLTFDDGGISAYTMIADELEARGWRGVFFVTSARLGQPGFLSGCQVRDLHERGHVIGSHSHTHPPRMVSLPRRAQRSEWRESIAILEDVIGADVRVASVPNGAYGPVVAEEAAAVGIDLLFTSDPTVRVLTDRACMVLGRYAIRSNTSARFAAALAAGDPLPRLVQAASWYAKATIKRVGGKPYRWLRERLLARGAV